MNLNEIRELADAAKRISDTVTLHLIAASDIMDPVGKWCSFSLEDGRSDGALYDSKELAMRYQPRNPRLYCYIQITPDGISVKDASRYLVISRHPMIDTTAPVHQINPVYYPRYSNLTSNQKRVLAQQVIKEREKAKDK